MRNSAVGEIRLPPEQREVRRRVVARISLRDAAKQFIVELGEVTVSLDASEAPPPHIPRPQPSIAEILSDYPQLPISSLRVDDRPWQGYVLIDLRTIHGRNPAAKEE